MRYVIIGNSAAGANCAEEIRKQDKDSQVTIISDEKENAYSRCLISRYLDGRLKEEGFYFKTRHFYKDFAIEAILGRRGMAIDRLGQKVTLDDKSSFAYDKLLLAVGSRPVRPKICGLDLKGVFDFHSLEDTRQILQYIKSESPKKAIVAGAGFVGLEAAYALRRIGLEVTVVERCAQILPNQFDYISSALIQDDLESLGVEIIVNESLASIGGNGRVEHVTVGGIEVPCALVIFATGVQPNTELASASGLHKQKGIIVDGYLNTSDQHIYAAGDCIEIEDVVSGRRQPSATWFNAVLQGKFAASNMTGKVKEYSGSVGIQNSVQFHRLSAVSFGVTQVPEDDLEYEVLSIYQKDKKIYKKLVMKGSFLCGMIFVGDIAKAGFYAALIRNKINVCEFKDILLNGDFSYAYLKEEGFGQLSSYAQTPGCWQNQHWILERKLCMGIK